MFGSILGSIFGSSEVIKAGVDFIDDLHYSDEEEAEDKRKLATLKTKSKIELMEAYAPFKIAQRYLAVMFAFTFLFSFFLTLAFALYGKPISEITKVLEMFYIGEIMLTIVMFYFGGGLTDSYFKGKNKKEE